MNDVEKQIVTDQITLTIGYDIENLTNPVIKANYFGEVTKDHYGRLVPKHAHGTVNFKKMTSSTEEITCGVLDLFDRIINPLLLVRRINISANHLEFESNIKDEETFVQLDIFNVNKQLTKEEEIKRCSDFGASFLYSNSYNLASNNPQKLSIGSIAVKASSPAINFSNETSVKVRR